MSKVEPDPKLTTKKRISPWIQRRAHELEKKAVDQKKQASQHVKDSKLLLTQGAGQLEAEGRERTYKFKQHQIRPHLDLVNEAKMFDLALPEFGPYCFEYSANGRQLLIGGRKGHVAAFDWKTGKLHCEVHLRETVRDVAWLHNETMFAVAQKDSVFIYDNNGLELHALRRHSRPNAIAFLPYHFLLASVGDAGMLRYQDISTGVLVAEHATRLGATRSMVANPSSAIVNLAHSDGSVSLWAPNMPSPALRLLSHRGPVVSLAVSGQHGASQYLATAGLEACVKVWDMRNLASPVGLFRAPGVASSLVFSQRGMMAATCGRRVLVWSDVQRLSARESGGDSKRGLATYMRHDALAPCADVGFAPFEDVLGVGHATGFSSLVVPGAGEPNYDALECNPYATVAQRREIEVKRLLEKLPADSIALDPNVVGSLAPTFKGFSDGVLKRLPSTDPMRVGAGKKKQMKNKKIRNNVIYKEDDDDDDNAANKEATFFAKDTSGDEINN